MKGQKIITINTGVMEDSVEFTKDFDNVFVAEASGTPLQAIRDWGDRGKAVELMGKGAATIISDLVSQNRVKGVIGMGGGGGTFMSLLGMQEVPFGIPKICLSTLATKDLSRQVGTKDITLIPSIVDVAGLNKISRLLIGQAAGALCGMMEATPDRETEQNNPSAKTIAISIFGNTTPCVRKCSELLKSSGYEVLTFHANGVGGATMESLIRENLVDAVLDITTTELADELCGGICSAGANRLTAASEVGIPQIVVPGCLDMVNFGSPNTLPEEFKSRRLYSWAPDVTLMRTNKEENEVLGKLLATRVNSSKGIVKVFLPLKGISQIDNRGNIFYDEDIDRSLFSSIKTNTAKEIEVVEVDAHINDDIFATTIVKSLLEII